MAAVQETYHSGLAGVQQRLQDHGKLTGEAKTQMIDEQSREADVEAKLNDLLASIGALAVHHEKKMTPAQAAAAQKAVEARDAFHSAVPNPDGPILKQIAAGLAALVEGMEGEGQVLAHVGANISQTNAAVNSIQETDIQPLAGSMAPVPQQYDTLMSQGAAVQDLVQQQIAIS